MSDNFIRYGIISIFLTLLAVDTCQANEYEITPFLGFMYSTDIHDSDKSTDISVSDDFHLGLALAWQANKHGQGQILINIVSHDFRSEINDKSTSLNIVYAHFSGVAQFKQQNYMTTLSIGVGGAYFDADNGSLYPSLTTALGTRYKIDNNFTIVTELRLYASLTDEEDDIFCQSDNCLASFDGALWFEGSISIGIIYPF